MAEQNVRQEGSSQAGQFGLSASVSDAVKDYYALLFDNVKEFIGHNEEGLKEYEQENAGLAAKLDAGDLDPSEEKSIRDTMRINTERIGEINDFLNSDMAIKVGIDFSAQMLDDAEPELTDSFNAAPVTEKYACLVTRYIDEYRTDLQTRVDLSHADSIGASFDVDSHRRDRPSAWDALTSLGSAGRQWAERLNALEQTSADKKKDWQDLQAYAETSSLVEIDAFQFGVEKTRELFPKIAEQHQEHNRREFEKMLAFDPFRLHDKLTKEYANFYIADAGKKFFGLQETRDAHQSRLQEHDAARPGWLENLKTFGGAEKAWKNQREVLAQKIGEIKVQMAEQHKKREACRDGWLSEAARKDAAHFIQALHPEVGKACERHAARNWEQANAARLEQQKERQAERESGNEQAPSNGLSR